MARLQQHYKEQVVPQLMEKFGYKTVMQVPRIEKITLKSDGTPSGTEPLDVD